MTTHAPQTHGLDIRQALKLGLLGGGIAVFLALLGMVEAFAQRDIVNGVIEMGRLLVLLCFFLIATLATRSTRRNYQVVLQGLLTGLVSSVPVALYVLLQQADPSIRNILVNATPKLLTLLTFEQDTTGGVFVLLAAGASLGALAGAVRLVPPVFRNSLFTAAIWVILLGLLQELLRVTAQNWQGLAKFADLLLAQNGLTVAGAIFLFAFIFLSSFAWATRGSQVRANYQKLPAPRRRVFSLVALAAAIVLLLLLPSFLGLFFSEVLVNVGLYVLMGLGLNIVVGFAGLLDLGYVAFFAIGAYTISLFTSTTNELVWTAGFNFWAALPFAIAMAVLFGMILGIPVLKIRGDYLAIVTLGFGEIIRLLALSEFLKPFFGGSRGIEKIPKPFLGTFELAGPQQLYYLILAGCLVVAFFATRLKGSRLGRAWMAIREDEDVAVAMGINPITTKLLAFMMGASFAGLSGAIFASKLGTIYPASFNLLLSINVLALIIIGGMGSIPGVIVGALVLVGLPELLREFSDFRLLVYGALLVLMMLVRPEGLWPEKSRQRELQEARGEPEPAETEPAAEVAPQGSLS